MFYTLRILGFHLDDPGLRLWLSSKLAKSIDEVGNKAKTQPSTVCPPIDGVSRMERPDEDGTTAFHLLCYRVISICAGQHDTWLLESQKLSQESKAFGVWGLRGDFGFRLEAEDINDADCKYASG